ncbi:SDR family NAD(P)-dependent oxidoreductase [Nocardioides pelophilus]|uniref:SDR family NAD(P)-dependent oxidoreductase n=1 Tax=Nocardioides pelophilus TaxID=2172019 RepID=UPI001603EFD1|nr:SDR family NAD(P)-dependent oxidoreductase [Nocardioides pelophilus]
MSTHPRIAVVVGGASGIGAATARALEDDGCTVVVADRNADLPGCTHVDVTDEASVQALLQAVVDEHGRLDLVVNTAGISTFGLVSELAVEEFRGVVDVNLTGSFLVVKHAAAHLERGGAIVLVSSLNGRQAGAAMAPYCAAKAGVNMLTAVAALELGPRGIRVNAIAPGLVVTPLTAPAMDIPGVEDDYLANTPLGRAGRPEEVAEGVVYLSRAEWMTGEVLDLNGGAHLMRYPDLHGHVTAAFG